MFEFPLRSCLRALMYGLSAASGSWGIQEISELRSFGRFFLSRVSLLKVMSPPARTAPGWRTPMTARARVDFPAPEAPRTATVSPGRISRETLSRMSFLFAATERFLIWRRGVMIFRVFPSV